jgi:hypothetical protein
MGNRLIFSTCVELKTLLPKLEQELTIPVLKEVASLYTIYVSNNMQWPDNLGIELDCSWGAVDK